MRLWPSCFQWVRRIAEPLSAARKPLNLLTTLINDNDVSEKPNASGWRERLGQTSCHADVVCVCVPHDDFFLNCAKQHQDHPSAASCVSTPNTTPNPGAVTYRPVAGRVQVGGDFGFEA